MADAESAKRTPSGTTRSQYDAYAPRYDRETGVYERLMLGDGRRWACSQARGVVLEVAVGTGLNLPYYPRDVRLTGIDLSSGMLAGARARARTLNLLADLVQADAQALPFPAGAFDTVLCTLGLSSIPDDMAAVREMRRVLRVSGRIVLLGHVASPHRPIRGMQHLIDRVAARRVADAQTRQVVPLLREAGFTIIYRHRSRGGVIERLTACRT